VSDQKVEQDAAALAQRLVRPQVLAAHAYQVPDATGLVKLDAMENPFTWPLELLGGWQRALASVHVNRYPDPRAAGVKRALAKAFAVPAGLDTLLGNGSDEIIQLLALAVARPGAVLLSPEPGFAMYRLIAAFAGLDYIGVDLAPDWSLDMPAMLEAVARHRPALVFLALPNNPTGNLFAESDVRAIVEATPGLVVLDEAYTAFTDADFLTWALDYPNVLVMRTLSKVGLAGLRLGMLFGRPAWLAHLEKLRLPYNIGVLVQATAEYALEHFAVFEAQTAELRRQREWLFTRLVALPGVDAWPSETNFLVLRLHHLGGAAAWQALKERGVLVKCLEGSHPSLAGCLRITVGTREENEALLAALATLV